MNLYMDSSDLFYNTEAEIAILGNIICNSELLYKLNEFNEDVFYSTSNREVFRALRKIMKEKGNIDVILIGDYIIKNKPKNITVSYISDLITSTIQGYNFDEYLNILIDLFQKRELRKSLMGIDFSKDATEIKGNILSDMNKLYTNREEEKIEDTVLNTVDEMLSGKVIKGVMTGIRSIDNNLMGFNKGELITISARSGIGKTTLALNMFTYQIYSGYKAHYFSLEMPKSEMIKKILSVKSNINNKKLRMNSLNEEEGNRIISLANNLASKNFNLYDNNSSLEFIESTIRAEKIKNNCDIVYIDLINRATTKQKAGTRAEYIGAMTRSLKQLALELKIPIVILAQINRGAEQRVDKRPLLSDLKESGSIEEDSDVVISVYRNLIVCDKNYQGLLDYGSNNPDKNPERCELGFMKSRYTGNATIAMMYKGDIGIIKDLMR